MNRVIIFKHAYPSSIDNASSFCIVDLRELSDEQKIKYFTDKSYIANRSQKEFHFFGYIMVPINRRLLFTWAPQYVFWKRFKN